MQSSRLSTLAQYGALWAAGPLTIFFVLALMGAPISWGQVLVSSVLFGYVMGSLQLQRVEAARAGTPYGWSWPRVLPVLAVIAGVWLVVRFAV